MYVKYVSGIIFQKLSPCPWSCQSSFYFQHLSKSRKYFIVGGCQDIEVYSVFINILLLRTVPLLSKFECCLLSLYQNIAHISTEFFFTQHCYTRNSYETYSWHRSSPWHSVMSCLERASSSRTYYPKRSRSFSAWMGLSQDLLVVVSTHFILISI